MTYLSTSHLPSYLIYNLPKLILEIFIHTERVDLQQFIKKPAMSSRLGKQSGRSFSRYVVKTLLRVFFCIGFLQFAAAFFFGQRRTAEFSLGFIS